MFSEPIVSLLLHGVTLTVANPGSQFGCASCAGFIAIGACQYGPEISFAEIFRNSGSVPVVSGQNRLRLDLSALCRKRKPACGFGIVLLHFIAGRVPYSESKLRSGVSLLCQMA